MTTKTCGTCYKRKDHLDFYKHPNTKDGMSSKCKECQKKYSTAYKKADPTRTKRYKNKSNKNIRSKQTLVERSAEKSVDNARKRTNLSADLFYGGLTFTEACAITVPFVKERLRLEAETGVAHHIDHIIPLAAGGTHTKENLQVLTAQENIAKGANE